MTDRKTYRQPITHLFKDLPVDMKELLVFEYSAQAPHDSFNLYAKDFLRSGRAA